MTQKNINSIPFTMPAWFEQQIDPAKINHHTLARVTAVHKNSYLIRKEKSTGNLPDAYAQVSGNLQYSVDSPTDLPTTGDWVYCDFYDEDTHAIIHGVLPRKSVIKRKYSGKTIDSQLIAANIDTAFIVQSANDNFNLRRLERYLVMVNDSDIVPVILLSKCDLVSAQELETLLAEIKSIAKHCLVIAMSCTHNIGINDILNIMQQGDTYCLLGSSGVGKTTLLNALIGEELYDTKDVSKKESKGRHTTTSRELVVLNNGAMIIDTPGMRELGNLSVDTGFDETFTDVITLTEQCKFTNCTHSNEKGCAIIAAIEQGELPKERFQNYQKMKSELEYHTMSYYDKRKKDKNFGKLIKSTLKAKRR